MCRQAIVENWSLTRLSKVPSNLVLDHHDRPQVQSVDEIRARFNNPNLAAVPPHRSMLLRVVRVLGRCWRSPLGSCMIVSRRASSGVSVKRNTGGGCWRSCSRAGVQASVCLPCLWCSTWRGPRDNADLVERPRFKSSWTRCFPFEA